MKDTIIKISLDMISSADTLAVPMDVRRIAEHYGYPIQFYSRARRQIETLHIEEMTERYPGVCVRAGTQYYIFISDELNADQERFTIAHELGHIALGHILPHPAQRERTAEEKEEQERQADLFALLLLAPAPLLDALEAKGPADIHYYTGLSMADSRRAYLNLEEHRHAQQEAAIRAAITHRASTMSKGCRSPGQILSWITSRRCAGSTCAALQRQAILSTSSQSTDTSDCL